MKYCIIFPIILMMLGCITTDQQRITTVSYIKDSRTNLCFAIYGLGFEYGVMSNVPCTPEVERLIDGNKAK